MKNLIFILSLSFILASCGADTPIPDGRIESINYPNADNWSDLYTTSEWKAFYKMKKVSFLTPEGVLEERMVAVDSFASSLSLSKEDAMELSVSLDAKVVKTHYSTKEWLPSWRKNLSFEKETIRREGSKVVFENEKGDIEMTFNQFLTEKEGLFVAMVIFMIFSVVGFGLTSFRSLEVKKDRKTLLITALIVWIIFSFLFSFWTEAFNLEIILTIFIFVFVAIFFMSLFFSFKKIKKQNKRNKNKRKNKLKQFSTKPS